MTICPWVDTIWAGVWTVLGLGIDRTGYMYGQIWTGVWTKLSYPMYKFLYIYNESTINKGFDAILCFFFAIFLLL